MSSTLGLGLRNLSRRKGRTALTVGMLLFSTWMMAFSAGLAEGSYADMIRMATGTFTGQVQILHPGYQESPSLFETVDDPGPTLARLQRTPGVVGAAARIETGALLAHGPRTTAALVVGVDPAAEQHTSTLGGMTKRGTLLGKTHREGALPMVVGAGLAKRLQVALGDEITLMGQAADGSMAADLFELVGVLDSGQAELDSQLALIRLSDAATLLELGKRVHRIAVALESPSTADAFVRDFAAPPGTVVLHWRDLLPGLEPSIASDRAGTIVFLLVILIVAALGGANAMLMTTMERRREIGVLLAIGTTPRQVVTELMWESTLQAVAGVGLGLLCGLLTIWYYHKTGLRFTEHPIEFGGATFDVMRPIVEWRTLTYPLGILISAALAGLWPALRVARMTPMEAMRAEARG